MSKNAIIIGMPRSGTSMTTNIFAKSGYFVAEDEGDQLRSGDEFNPSGYWEAEPLIEANAQIFSDAKYNHDNTWLYDPISADQAENINTLKRRDEHKDLVNTYNKNTPWVWKDPRLCYTISYWWELMNDNTGVLLLKRDHDEIYNSFIRLKWREKNNESKADVMKRIKDHISTAELALKKYNIPYISVDYSDFKNNPVDTANKINLQGKIIKFTDMIGNMLSDPVRKKIKKIIPVFVWKLIYPNKYTK